MNSVNLYPRWLLKRAEPDLLVKYFAKYTYVKGRFFPGIVCCIFGHKSTYEDKGDREVCKCSRCGMIEINPKHKGDTVKGKRYDSVAK